MQIQAEIVGILYDRDGTG